MTGKHSGMSIVVPYLNEVDGIKQYCDTVNQFAQTIDYPLEIIFVDDGSTDNTSDLVREYKFENIEKVKIVTFSKNYGSHAAIRAGVQHATYDICTWMGSDLQEPLEFLSMSYKKIEEGYDAVYIEKNTIKVSFANRLFSKIYSALMRKYAVSNYASGGISNIVFNRKIIDFLNENIESNSSIMLQIMDAGYKNCTIALDYNERMVGKSKWTLKKKIKLFIDSFVSFSFMPIRLVSIIGVCFFMLGCLVGIWTLVNKVMNPAVPIGYSTIVSVLALGFGVTNISLGIIAEYLWRAYDAARKRPAFLVSSVETIKGTRSE
ncbi:MAG: glycosyltransferase [Eubacteriales bacterium]|nr:glycosyltransferase [Eubacteriales bacterium]